MKKIPNYICSLMSTKKRANISDCREPRSGVKCNFYFQTNRKICMDMSMSDSYDMEKTLQL